MLPANCFHDSRTLIQNSKTPEIIDPQEKNRQRDKRIEEEMHTSPLVADAETMGFEKSRIRGALRKWDLKIFTGGFILFFLCQHTIFHHHHHTCWMFLPQTVCFHLQTTWDTWGSVWKLGINDRFAPDSWHIRRRAKRTPISGRATTLYRHSSIRILSSFTRT